MNLNILINKNLELTIVIKKEEKFIILSNNLFYIKYKINNNTNLFFNKNNKILNLKINYRLNDVSYLNDFIKNYNFSISSFFIKKIKFSGKSYKIKKKKKKIIFVFNKSHIEVVTWKNFFLKKIKKNKILIKTSFLSKIDTIGDKIVNIRPNNIFNKRGLRNSKKLILKKIGKKTS